jgi:ribonuclease P protein component
MTYAEAYISTEQPTPRQDPRLPCAHGDEGRSPGFKEASGQGAEAPDSVALLSRTALREDARLRNPAEFRAVYNSGRRFDSRLMTVFVLVGGRVRHRLGITASKKMSRRAVDRNRTKRLLREAFRQNSAGLDALKNRYDWVINARRSMLEVKSQAVAEAFGRIVAQVQAVEHEPIHGTEA